MPVSLERGALTEATFLILLSLCEPRHGYGVMQAVDQYTNGRVSLGAGTLYGALGLLSDKNWIAEDGGAGRKKFYRITDEGMLAVANEMKRLFELLTIGNEILFTDVRRN